MLFTKAHTLKKTSSTNRVAFELAKKGAKEGEYVVSKRQSSGRGRFQRKWFSPPGNVYVSFILRPSMPASALPQLTFVSALAVSRTLEKYLQMVPQLKWPNDVLVQGKKISGILSESQTDDEKVEFVIIGIGININQKGFPKHLSHATSLFQVIKKEIDIEEILGHLLDSFEEWYGLFQKKGFAFIKEAWEEQGLMKGREVELKDGRKKIKGIALGLDTTGALIIKTQEGDMLPIYSGDLIWF